MRDPRCASLFLSNMVGNEMKRSVDDVNCDDMIDRQFKQLLDARNEATECTLKTQL